MYKNFFKRFLDICVALVALPFFALIFIFIAPIVHFEDKGPVFYCGERMGRKGKVFKMYKFRSMRVNSPDIRLSDGSTYNGEDDPRVTKIGKLLRASSIDETPQILNILKGDMSLIGPRPTLTSRKYDSMPSEERKRYDVRPGITGYSQAYFRNSVRSEDKLKNDCYYIDHLSFGMDVKVFFHTILSVLKRENVFISDDQTIDTNEHKSVMK